MTDEVRSESPAGDEAFALPRYGLATGRVCGIDEPRLSIVTRDESDVLVICLLQQPGPAFGDGVAELPHALAVALKYREPVLDGGALVKELPFDAVLLDETAAAITAELSLGPPGLREQLLAALSSLAASVTLVASSGVRVGVPNGDVFKDGTPAYVVQQLLLDHVVPPTPLVLGAQQLERLGGGAGRSTLQPMVRVRVPHAGRCHAYWQDPARPEHYYFLPDRCLLAGTPEAGRPPLPVQAVAADGADATGLPRAAVGFSAQPRIDPAYLTPPERCWNTTRARGGDEPVQLELLSEAQPLLRLSSPRGGAPSAALTDRQGTEIDLERGLVHAETMAAADFHQVCAALFGAC